MIKSWYLSVRDETMAPARMVTFMEQHVATCEICLQDPDLKNEIAKITELVLPESKIPKAIRQQTSLDDEDDSDIEDNGFLESGGEDDDDIIDDEQEDEVDDLDPEEDEFLEDDAEED